MKFKALRRIDTKEFVVLKDIGFGKNLIFTQEFPDPKPITATIEGLRDYHNRFSPLQDENYFNLLELVEIEIYEAGVLGADIRNKLGPINNLNRLLEDYFSDESKLNKKKIKRYILTEIENSKNSVEYLKNLL